MLTLKFSKKQIDWSLWLLEKRYGALTPQELVMSAVREIVADQSNRTSLEVSTPTKKARPKQVTPASLRASN